MDSSGDSDSSKDQSSEKSKNDPLLKKQQAPLPVANGSVAEDEDDSVLPSSSSGPAAGRTGKKEQEDIMKQLELLTMNQRSAPKTIEEAKQKGHQFWETQPVPGFDEVVTVNEAIEPDKEPSAIRQEPYSLPQGFSWSDIDIENPRQLQELYSLLNENYVEDDDNMFRFDYSPEFLKWALKPPGWLSVWHCGVRVAKSGKLIGFIAAIPVTVRIIEHAQKMVEINFLCVHKKLRAKRVAPVLIREITRRVNQQGIFQAVYTAGVILPKPVSTCRYWHRSLNPKKLIEVKFSHIGKNMTLQRTLKLYKLPDEAKISGFRQMTPTDIPVAYRLLGEYLKRFDLAPIFSVEEFQHWFTPQLDVVDSFVVERDGMVTDFVSFYTLPSTVMHHPTYKTLKAAYSFYNVAKSAGWVDLMTDALIVAKQNGYDVFNALDLMDNKEFLEKLKFGIGDGNLQYYLYNWKCPDIPGNKVGLVLQ